ncbi:MAG TPA: glycosyltransferase family 39 protein [Caldimonas sp.]|nr:glycosyltransferase family 39 protein [Caldimonas sp.]
MDAGREGVGSEGGLTPAGVGTRVAAAWRSAPTLLTALAIWLAFTAGVRPLLLPDEGRYAWVAFEMLHGDALVPTLDGLPFFHKPPLFYWLDIAAMRVLGANAFSARFGSLVGAWSLGAALFLFLRARHGIDIARRALVVLATCPFYFLAAQYANHDMLVAGLITAAVLAFVNAADGAGRVRLAWTVAAWAASGLALLSKGLIGIVLPALVVGPWLLAQRRWREVLALLHPLALGAFAIVALPWMLAMQSRYPGFFDYFIVEQHFRRYAASSFNNVLPFWFLAAALALATLPWSAWLVARARSLWRRPPRDAALMAWWVVAIVGFFSVPSSKLVGYVLPALAPWCTLVALATRMEPTRTQLRRASVAAGAAVSLAVVAALAWQTPRSNRALAAELAGAVAPDDIVVMVDDLFYDVPFLAGIRSTVVVVSDWSDPAIARHDNWKKELADAARFDPGAAARVLRPVTDIDALACGSGHAWFIAKAGAGERWLAPVPNVTRMRADAHAELWRAPRHACSTTSGR